MSIVRYIGQPLNVIVGFSENPLLVYGYDYTDVEDISMNLKKNLVLLNFFLPL